jgi:hypothetical protein
MADLGGVGAADLAVMPPSHRDLPARAAAGKALREARRVVKEEGDHSDGESEAEDDKPPAKRKRGRPRKGETAPVRASEPTIQVGCKVLIVDGPSRGLRGEVASVVKAWMHVTLEDGSDVSVRRMHLAMLGVDTGGGEGHAGADAQAAHEAGTPAAAAPNTTDGPLVDGDALADGHHPLDTTAANGSLGASSSC